MDSNCAIPGHLRRFIVRQEYERYTAQDQAVWRFVVLQTHARLLSTAHEAYAHGFSAAGISVDRIPRIDEMNEQLGRFGWGAVAVDGFIPPRAFQAFQARGILPIAADIRTSKHLTYTPAPDIIHEAAGHAPFLADPRYARYVRRIGEVARRAFGTLADREVYDAIHTLSELKEDPSSTASQVRRAEEALAATTTRVSVTSESAKVARLYWWTAEYGLVGTPSDYRLYGAGLLSSVGEGYFCQLPNVRKLPLTSGCTDVDYDVTRAQPQLFVAKSFDQLEEVLDEVDAKLTYRLGGRRALETAKSSEELATVVLDTGVEIAGRVTRIYDDGGAPSLVEFSGPTVLALGGNLLDSMPRSPTGYHLPLGVLKDGTSLSRLSPEALGRRVTENGRLVLTTAAGLELSGTIRALLPFGERVGAVLLADFVLARQGSPLVRAELYPLALGDLATAWAGAPDGFFDDTPPSPASVPKLRTFAEADLEMIALYDRAIAAFRGAGGSALGHVVEELVARLDDAYPEEWLLRWNLLESLVKAGERPDLAAHLETDLEQLERHFDALEPIATGLAYIRSLTLPNPSGDRRFAG